MKYFSLTLFLLAVLRLTPSGLIAVHFEQLMEGRQKASAGIQQQFSGNESIGVYPNPANSHVTFINPFSNDETLRVYSLQGKLIFSDQVSGNSVYMLNLSDLPVGMYVVEMGTLRSKFIVSKS
jgi:hypothetical protein